jgi:acetyl esterase/lipase
VPARRLAFCLAIVLAACSSGDDSTSGSRPPTSPATRAPRQEVTVRRGVVYGRGTVGVPQAGQADLHLDLYEPAGGGTKRPVVVLVHGGGFVEHSREDVGLVPVAMALAGRGIVAASIDYRLQGTEPEPSARVAALRGEVSDTETAPAQVAAIDDTLTAVDYLHDHAAELRIDPDRLGLVGSSAGGFTVDAVAYALDDHDVARPPVRFVASLWGGLVVAAPGGPEAQPVDQVDEREPALFAVHGDADTIVPVTLSDDLVARAEAAGLPTEYHRIRGGGHGPFLSGFFDRPVRRGETPSDRLVAFARAQLR